MENRFSLGNKEIAPNNNQLFKRYLPSQDISSPKFTRKRTDVPNFISRKFQKRSDQIDQITYISPKKYLENQNVGVNSQKSSKSNSYVIKMEVEKQKENTVSHQWDRESVSSGISVPSTNEMEIQKFQSAEQIIARVRAVHDTSDNKIKCQNGQKKTNQFSQKIKSLKQQNSYLYKRVQDFNQVIKQKNQIINQFSLLLKQKDENIMAYQNQMGFLKKKNEQLQSIISLLNKSYDEQKFSCNQLNQTADSDKSIIQKQVQKYKSQIEQLTQKVKYCQLQSTMYQKLRYDLNGQLQKNDTLKLQNKKLISRIEYLTELLHANKINSQKIYGEKFGHLNAEQRRDSCQAKSYVSNSRKDLEISFQLSPEK